MTIPTIEPVTFAYRLPAEGEIVLREDASQAEYRAAREEGRPIVFVTEEGLIRERLAPANLAAPPSSEAFDYDPETMTHAEYVRLRREGKVPARK